MGIKEQYQAVTKTSFLNLKKFGESVTLISPAAVETTVLGVIEWIPEIEEKEIEDGEKRDKTAIVSISTLASNGVVGVGMDWTMRVNTKLYAVEQINPDEFGMMDIQIRRRPRDKDGTRRRNE